MAQWWSFSALQFEKMFEQGLDLECMDTNALCVFVSLQRFVLFLFEEMKASQWKSSILSWLLFFRTLLTFSLGMKQSQRSLLPLRSKISSLELETLRSKKFLTEQCRYLHTATTNIPQLVLVAEDSEHWTVPRPNCLTGLTTRVCLGSVVPCAVEVDLTRVQLNVLPLIEDAVDDGLQHLVQIQHADSLKEGGKKSVVMHNFCMGCDWLKFK